MKGGRLSIYLTGMSGQPVNASVSYEVMSLVGDMLGKEQTKSDRTICDHFLSEISD